MMGTKTKSQHSLQRAIARYEAKLAEAQTPTRRQYAAGMLRMAKDALEASRAGEPTIEVEGDNVVDLHKGEYAEV